MLLLNIYKQADSQDVIYLMYAARRRIIHNTDVIYIKAKLVYLEKLDLNLMNAVHPPPHSLAHPLTLTPAPGRPDQ